MIWLMSTLGNAIGHIQNLRMRRQK